MTDLATKRPWRVTRQETEKNEAIAFLYGKTRLVIAQYVIVGPVGVEVTTENAAADADLIVTAVNERDALLARVARLEAACRIALACFDDCGIAGVPPEALRAALSESEATG